MMRPMVLNPSTCAKGGKCVEAGEFPIFQNGGVGRPTDFSSVEVFDDKNAGMSESWIMVTKVAAEEGWNLMKPLTAKMRPGGYLNFNWPARSGGDNLPTLEEE